MHFHFGLVEVFYKETTMNYRKMIVWQKAMNLTEAVCGNQKVASC